MIEKSKLKEETYMYVWQVIGLLLIKLWRKWARYDWGLTRFASKLFSLDPDNPQTWISIVCYWKMTPVSHNLKFQSRVFKILIYILINILRNESYI